MTLNIKYTKNMLLGYKAYDILTQVTKYAHSPMYKVGAQFWEAL